MSHEGNEVTAIESSDLSQGEVIFTEETMPPPAVTWKQLVVLVNDGSTSMTWELAEPDETLGLPARTKAAAVQIANRDLVNRMKASRVAVNFSFAWVTFNTVVTDERAPKPVREIEPEEIADPTAAGTGGTNIAVGLERADAVIDRFLGEADGEGMPASAVVIVQSDGETADPQAAIRAADALKSRETVSVAATLFATKGQPSKGAQLLQALASTPSLYETTFDAEQLRKFMMASIAISSRRQLGGGSNG